MDKKKEKQSVLQLLFGFMDRANGDHVGAYAAQAAYFLIMSFIPFILFLTTIIRQKRYCSLVTFREVFFVNKVHRKPEN